jgi:ABC-type amino acid transport substrate-binding protein
MPIGPQKAGGYTSRSVGSSGLFCGYVRSGGSTVRRNQPRAAATLQKDASQSTASLELPLTFERHVGDLDGMKKRRVFRVLVVPSHSGFFYDKGHPQGISFEAFGESQRFANQKLKTGSLRINVTYIPVRPEQLEKPLLEGVGDVVGYGVIVTPEREQKVLFTAPIETNVKQVIVTGPKAPAIATLRGLQAGKKSTPIL